MNELVAVLEAERDTWRTRSLDDSRRAQFLEQNLQSLARDHQRLELATAAVSANTRVRRM